VSTNPDTLPGWDAGYVVMRFARTRETPEWAQPGSLLEGAYDFGFSLFERNPLLSALPAGARAVVQTILDTPRTYVPPVISEVPQTWEELEKLEPELFEPILETRPNRIPDPYPQPPVVALPPPEELPPAPSDDNGEEMAHNWGHLAREFIGDVLAPSPPPLPALYAANLPAFTSNVPSAAAATPVAPGGECDGMQWSGGAPPKGYKVVNYCGKGVLRKVRRRRRRRLLTASDSRDIATIVGLVGKGQMASALINRR